jgi:hypothetical protein
MTRIVTDAHPDFVRIVLFIPAVELLGIHDQIFIRYIAYDLHGIASSERSTLSL